MTTDLTTGAVASRLRRQATPFAVGLIALISFDAVDLFFLSRLGDEPLAAISFTFPIVWLLSSVIIGFEAGAASCISRAVGKNDEAMARRQTTDTAMLAVLVSMTMCMIGLIFMEPIFRTLGATDELMPLIDDYMGIWFFAEPAAAMMWTCLASMRARGNALLEGKIITTASIINAILDPIFIFGLFGFPRMEIAGAALATLVANAVMLISTLGWLHFKLRVFATPFTKIANILDSWRRMLHVGLPAIGTNAIVPIANGIIVAMIATYGVDAVAGFGIAMRVEPIFLLVFYSLSAVTSPFMGQNHASHRYDRVAEARLVIGRFCLYFGLALAAVMFAVAEPIAAIFSKTEAIRDVAVDYLRIMAISYGGYGLVMATCAAFNGIGNPGPGLVISILRVIVLFLPLAFAGQWLFGMHGIFAASAASNIVVAIIGFIWLGRRISAEAEPESNL
ncbi:MAG: MATE family efflux transporter [Gammaproteobacteria bacterium]|nr:MATE family efflux transporter [Gammaproteobacteria bacterium]